MQIELDEEDRAFAAELRAWLEANIDAADDEHAWHERLVAGRWAVPSWPERWGGRDATLTQEMIYNRLMGEFDAPPPRNSIALFNIGPMLMEFGTADQQQRWLPPMVTAEEIWCQGFSEPGAGSDLAALETRAEDRGDHWVVSGQKVWTSFAAEARWCLALVRTSPDAPKHAGITALVVDMTADGVEVRPLVEITGEAGFNEIFLDEVIVPKEQVVGQVDGGWKVAMSTLTHERLGTMKLGVQLRNRRDQLLELARTTGSGGDPVVRQRLAALAVQVDLMQLLTEQALGRMQRGEDPGASLPLGKLQWSELMQELAEAAVELQGPRGELWHGSPHEPEGEWQHRCVYSRMTTIGAGTTQVQKNIIAYRILGLPRGADGEPGAGLIARDRPLPEEQASLRDTVRRFLEERCPVAWVRERLDEDTGTDPDRWRQLADLGLPAVLVPAEHGGLGLGYEELGVVLEEMGRALHPGPYLSTALGAVAAVDLAGDDTDRTRWLPDLADGSRVGTVALVEPDAGWDWRQVATAAVPDGDEWRLSGTKLFVPAAAAADLLVVTARTAGELGLFAVPDPSGPAVRLRRLETIDATRKRFEVVLQDAPARRLGNGPADDAVATLVDRLVAGYVMDTVGAAGRALELATDYAKVREQFDRPIGSFQAVQHLLADMLRRVELARVAGLDALRAADGGDPGALHRAATIAKAYAGDALHRATADAIQVFGGVGFTWEHDAHLYYKRALSMQHTHGGSRRHLEAYAGILLDGAAAGG